MPSNCVRGSKGASGCVYACVHWFLYLFVAFITQSGFYAILIYQWVNFHKHSWQWSLLHKYNSMLKDAILLSGDRGKTRLGHPHRWLYSSHAPIMVLPRYLQLEAVGARVDRNLTVPPLWNSSWVTSNYMTWPWANRDKCDRPCSVNLTLLSHRQKRS